ncbi:MAG: ERCC4 domain-containing protein, partial [Natrinema limicola]
VDLVLFYEPVPTAIRSIQRKGRTGRQSEGRVVVLMAEDTRDEAYFWISRRREKEMESELRDLKGMADELEDELDDSQQSLADFEGEADSECGVKVDGNGGNADAVGDCSTGSEGVADQPGLQEFGDTEADTDEDGEVETHEPHAEGDTIGIVADQREMDANIARDLSRREEYEISLETLSVGDYVLSDRVVVERKSVADFVDSLVGGDRSVFEQVGAMARHYSRPIVVVEGEGLYEQRDIHPNAVRGALSSLAVDFGASVLRTESEADTTELLAVIAGREQATADREVSVHGEKGTKTLSEQQEYVVASIAEIGPVTARSLLEEFGTVEEVMIATEDELQDADGVGQVTAERIREVIGSDYTG